MVRFAPLLTTTTALFQDREEGADFANNKLMINLQVFSHQGRTVRMAGLTCFQDHDRSQTLKSGEAK